MNTAFILEDVPESKIWLSEVLNETFVGIKIFSANKVEDALAQLKQGLTVEIALIDLNLPDGSGIKVIEWLNQHSPQTICVVASIYDDDKHIFPAIRAGAHGYLLKDQTQESLMQALKGILTDHPPLSPAIARRLLSHFQVEPNFNQHKNLLTDREIQVLTIIARGLTIREVAVILQVKPNTVSGYVKEIYRKLNVSSRAEVTLAAQKMGLV